MGAPRPSSHDTQWSPHIRNFVLSLVAAALCAGAASTQAAPIAPATALSVVKRIPGPDGGWDYASFDAARRRIYIAHGGEVLMLDVDGGLLNTTFAVGNHLHAIVPVPGSDVLVTTNSGDNSVRIIRAADGGLIKSLPVADDADGAVYDPSTGLVLVVNGEPGLLTLVDPVAGAVVGTIKVGDALEFAVVDGKGRAYVNVESTGEIAVVDIAKRSVVGRYRMTGCTRPTGLAYVEGDRLISACASNMAKILDGATGREIASLEIGPRPDAVLYDPSRHLAFVPTGGDGALSVIALDGPADNSVIATASTQTGARTGAVDPKTGRIYLPTAEFLPPASPGQRPAIKPTTFQILVLDRR
jgi:DNA-binding beta-propeller fold protein YncE